MVPQLSETFSRANGTNAVSASAKLPRASQIVSEREAGASDLEAAPQPAELSRV